MTFRFFLIAITTLTLFFGCGGESECEQICGDIRQQLIDNFGVDAAAIDCSDPKWVGDCEHCTDVLKRDFQIVPISCR